MPSYAKFDIWQNTAGIARTVPLQIVSARTGAYYSTSSTSWTDITGLSVDITPYFSTSKILIILSLGRATTAANNLDYVCTLRVLRNGSDDVAINGNTDGSRLRGCMNVNGLAFNSDHSPGGWSCQAIDSPNSASLLTYKAQVICQTATYAFIMNGVSGNGNSNNSYHYRAQSSLTLMEIAQ